MGNLRGRLTAGITLVLAVVLCVAGWVIARETDRSERAVLDDQLRRTAELSRATALTAVEEELPGVDRRLEAVLRASGSSLRLTIGGKALLDAGIPVPGRPPLGLHTVSVGDRRYRTYVETLRAESLGGLARLEVARSLRGVERRQHRLRRRLAIIIAAALAASAAGAWFAADVVLRPLRRLRRGTAQIATEADLGTAVPVEGPGELRALATSFNAMLERLRRSAADRERALAATRRFAADAGHELRTPLTSVQATLSVLARHPELAAERRTELAEDALAEQRRLVELLDGLQAFARGDSAPTALERTPVDLVDVVDAAVAAARERWPRTTFAAALPDGTVERPAWEPGLRVIADNLLANAARHGRPDGTVRVTLNGGAHPVLVVEDDGPGVPDAERERVFQPFARVAAGDGPVAPGSGLGLALVAQQARLHGATVTLDRAPQLGGARFTVRF